MNKKIFNQLMKQPGLQQESPEWKLFLDFCSMYLKNHKIKNPIVVELGIGEGRQKEFYEQLFDAEHIGIDMSDKQSIPDILGDTHDPKTMNMLNKKLKGRPINILFIDCDHRYEAVKQDFMMYVPLCSDIIAMHNIETCEHRSRHWMEVWKFWDELKFGETEATIEYRNFQFLAIHKRRKRGGQRGIGLIIKK